MAKREKNSGRAVFYKPITDAEQIRCGYLYKSPPKTALKLEWKRRYFVLFKTNDQNYQLRYYRSVEEKGQALGGIDLTQISLIYGNPQHHQKWIWVQKTFKCSPSCVLYIRAGTRDYFLVGETSTDVDGWFNDLCKAMEYRPHKYLSKEEISNGQPAVDIITNPLQRRKYSAPEVKAPFIAKAEEVKNNGCKVPSHALLKTRSVSDPSSNEVEGNTEKEQEKSKRPVSEPLRFVYYEDYDYPRSFLKAESEGNGVTQASCTEPMYETMSKFEITHDTPEANNREVEQIFNGTLMRSITQVFDKFMAKSPPPFPISEEAPFEGGEDKRHSSDFSGSSSSANSPVDFTNGQEKQDDSESTPEERNFMVMQSDLKKHLTLTDVEGKPSVSGWTGQPQSVCFFHKGDQVLAINDLHTSTVEEVNMFISRSLKNEVKVTILRQRGRQPLHLPNSPCSD